MGQTAAASEDALLGLWVNPAALAGAPGQVGATHTEWFQDTRLEQLGVVLGGGGRLVLGLSTQLVTTGDIPLRPLSAGVPIPYSEPLGTFDARDFGVGLTAAYQLVPSVDVGATVRWLSQKVYVSEASTVGMDLGLAWQAKPALRVAANLGNVGPALKWDGGVEAPLPRTFRAGAWWSPARTLSLSSDLWLQRDRPTRGTFGAQWSPVPFLSVRGGYVAGHDAQNITGGLGLVWRGFGFDYALVPVGNDLGTTHRVAIHFTPSLQKRGGRAH
jgi:hypothetical protein